MGLLGDYVRFLKKKEYPYFVCTHLFAKKYQYLIANKAQPENIRQVYNGILSQSNYKFSKSIAAITMLHGYHEGIAGNIDEGVSLINESIGIFKIWYKNKNNKNIAMAMVYLGLLYQHDKQYDLAESKLVEALRQYEEIYLKLNTNDYGQLLKMLVINSLDRGDVFMAKHYAEKHDRAFGREHLRSILIRHLVRNLKYNEEDLFDNKRSAA